MFQLTTIMWTGYKIFMSSTDGYSKVSPYMTFRLCSQKTSPVRILNTCILVRMGRLNLNWPIYLTNMNMSRFIYVLFRKIHGSHLSMLTCTPTMNTEPIRSDEIIMDRWLTQQQPM